MDDIKAVIQVFPEIALFHLFFQVAVGGGNDPHINFMRLISAYPGNGFILQKPQQFTCISKGISPISSKKTVPLSAISSLPDSLFS